MPNTIQPPELILTPAELDRIAERVADLVAARLADQPVLVDKRTLSRRTGLSEKSIERRVSDGTLPIVRVGRRVLFDLGCVLAALSERAQTQGAESP